MKAAYAEASARAHQSAAVAYTAKRTAKYSREIAAKHIYNAEPRAKPKNDPPPPRISLPAKYFRRPNVASMMPARSKPPIVVDTGDTSLGDAIASRAAAANVPSIGLAGRYMVPPAVGVR